MAPWTSLLTYMVLAPLAAAATLPADFNIAQTLGLSIKNFQAVDKIEHRYIAVYNDSLSDAEVTAHEALYTAEIKKRNLNKRGMHGKLLSTDVYPVKVSSMRAMIFEGDDQLVLDMSTSKKLAWIEVDRAINGSDAIAQTNAPSGLRRLSAAGNDGQNYVFDQSAGEGITVYVLDTGIRVTHQEFEGRAVFGGNFIDQVDDDDNGHGTHVAGTIGGATFGVAKKAQLVGVKVLSGDGSGSNSAVLRAMTAVRDDVVARGTAGKAVLNMSLGGGFSRAINTAVAELRAAGIVPVVAAGNEDVDTKDTSPGSAEAAITVGAIDGRTDVRAPFSNFGPAVDIYAPGVNVLSCGIASDTDAVSLSGTSMASPHVAGLAAYLMSMTGASTPDEVQGLMIGLAERSDARVIDNKGDTVDLIANNGNL